LNFAAVSSLIIQNLVLCVIFDICAITNLLSRTPFTLLLASSHISLISSFEFEEKEENFLLCCLLFASLVREIEINVGED
jgi:hypothetical protein